MRDALTLFDENGAVLDAPPALWEALDARDWHALFVTERALWRDARLLVFGHALLEKLVTPRKALTAHVLRAPGRPARSRPTTRDLRGAGRAAPRGQALCAAAGAGRARLVGAENENFSFYDDSDVFRPRRALEPTANESVLQGRPHLKRPAGPHLSSSFPHGDSNLKRILLFVLTNVWWSRCLASSPACSASTAT